MHAMYNLLMFLNRGSISNPLRQGRALISSSATHGCHPPTFSSSRVNPLPTRVLVL